MAFVERVLQFEGDKSRTYRARDDVRGFEVLLNFFKGLLPDRSARFDEAMVLVSFVSHDALPAYVEHGREGDELFLATRCDAGPTLAEHLAAQPVEVDKVLALAERLYGAIDTAHRFGIVHGRIRADQVVLPGGSLDRAVLTGLGQNLVFDDADDLEKTVADVTKTGARDWVDTMRLLYRAITGLDPSGPPPADGWPSVRAGGAPLPNDVATAIDRVVRGDEAAATSAATWAPLDTKVSDATMPTSRRASGPSSRLPEPYRVSGEIARGGMGAILDAVDDRIHRELAVKVLLDPSAPAEIHTRFLEEAQIQGQLEHPSVCPVHALGTDLDGHPFFAMKKVRGESLHALLARVAQKGDAASPLRRRLEIFVKVCEGIAFAHDRGVIHRDLKPANIMVGEFGEVLVMDWGLARSLDGADSSVATARAASNGQLTSFGQVMGTLQFMPPEQAHGDPSIDERADVYALGAILYQILTLEPPIDGPSYPSILIKVIRNDIKSPLERTPHRAIPEELDVVTMKALAGDRDHRYASASELREDVQAYLDGRVLGAVDYSPFDVLKKWAGRNRTFVTTALAALCLLLVGGTFYFVQVTSARRDAEQQLLVSLQAQATALGELDRPRESRDRWTDAETLARTLDEPTTAMEVGRWLLADRAPTSLYDVDTDESYSGIALIRNDARYVVAGRGLELRETLTATVHRRYALRSPARRLVVSRSGRWAAVHDEERSVFLVDLESSGAPERIDVEAFDEFGSVSDIAATGDRFLVVDDRRRAVVVDPLTRRPQQTFGAGKISEELVVGASSYGSDPLVVFADRVGWISVVRVEDGRSLGWTATNSSDAVAVDVSASNDALLIASKNTPEILLAPLRSYRTADALIRHGDTRRLAGHLVPPQSAMFSRDGTKVLSTDPTGRTILFDRADGRVERVFGSRPASVAAAISRDSRFVVTADRMGRISLWPARTDGRWTSVANLETLVTGAALADDRITMTTHDGTEIVDVRSGRRIRSYVQEGLGLAVAGSSVVRHHDRVLRVVDTKTGSVTIAGEVDGSLVGVAVARNGRRLAALVSGDRNVTLTVWERGRAAPVAVEAGPYYSLRSLAMSHDGRHVAVGAGAVAGKTRRNIVEHQRVITIFDIGANGPRHRVACHGGSVRALVFSSDDRRLYSSASDGTICVTDVETGRVLRRTGGVRVPLTQLALSADGRILAGASEAGQFVIVDAVTLQSLPRLPMTDDGVVVRLFFDRAGDMISVNGLGTVRRFHISSVLASARRRPERMFGASSLSTDDVQGLAEWYSFRGEIEAACTLLEQRGLADGADKCPRRNKSGGSSLYRAAAMGNVAKVRRLLAARADPNAPRGDGRTPLEGAVRSMDIDLVRVLLEGGADTNPRTADTTPLEIAAFPGRTRILETLLANGAKVGRQGSLSPIERSATLEFGARAPALDVLLESHVRAPSPSALFGALRLAVKQDAVDTIARMAAIGIPVDQIPRSPLPAEVPLLEALREGRTGVATQLLKSGADANRADDLETPLTWAARNGDVEAIRLLMKHGANLNLVAPDGTTPLTAGVLAGELFAVATLLAFGAISTQPDGMARRPDVLLCTGDGAVVLTWFAHSREGLRRDGADAFAAAVRSGNADVVMLLVAVGVEIDVEHIRSFYAEARRDGRAELASVLAEILER